MDLFFRGEIGNFKFKAGEKNGDHGPQKDP